MNKICDIPFAATMMLFFVACTPQKDHEADRNRLMKLHDEEMAHMGKIHDLKARLAHLRDSVLTDSGKQDIQQKISSLNKADEAMMDWMHHYKEPEAEVSTEQKIKYYQEEQVKMEKVKQLIEQSIDSSTFTIRKYSK